MEDLLDLKYRAIRKGVFGSDKVTFFDICEAFPELETKIGLVALLLELKEQGS